MNVRLATIGDYVQPVGNWNPATKPEVSFFYVDLSAVSQAEKQIISAASILGSEAPSRARQLVQAGDILVSTVRPNLNGVAAVTEELDGATASTGFCVLRPRPEKLLSNYLMQWVRSPRFIDLMVKQATGASYPAVTDRMVKSSLMPLPPLDEQRRIAAILDKADALRRKRKRALELLDSLTQSIFFETFGDGDEYERRPVADIALLVTDGEHQTPKRTSAGIKLLSARNIQMGYIDASNVDFIDEQEYQRISKRLVLQSTDVLVSCSGTIGRASLLRTTEPIALVRSVAVIRPKDIIVPLYLQHYLLTARMQAVMKAAANSSGQPNLFQNQIKRLEIAIPPIDLQNEFARKVEAIRRLTPSFARGEQFDVQLFSALQQRAFSGHL